MARKNLSRRDFLSKTGSGIAGASLVTGISSFGLTSCKRDKRRAAGSFSSEAFIREVELLPQEELYDHHEYLTSGPVHFLRRDKGARPGDGEMAIPDSGWKLICNPGSSVIIKNVVSDFQDYLNVSQNVKVEVEEKSSLSGWKDMRQSIVVGTAGQLPGCGLSLKGSKDYEIVTSPEQIIICGYDDRGAMHGLYNLEAVMNLREAPILPASQKKVRHSVFDARLVLSWMGWMDYPDVLLSHMAHDGFDGILVGVYSNPNNDRTTAETSTDWYARGMYGIRHQDPKLVRNLIDRAAKYGISIYTQIIWQYLGTRESENGLRKLVKEIVTEFPEIRGYILLTEGFWYKEWRHGHGSDKEYMKDWARNWCEAVGIVEQECHKLNPDIEILPWEYNINCRPQNEDIKRYFIQQLPVKTVPMPTWDKGKSFDFEGMKGYLNDYALNQIGPAEVTAAQVDEANKRGMKVYTKVDTFASWQYGTQPYLPCPNQWFERYRAIENTGIKGTLESWTSGYKPNFMSELRAWTCWSEAPSQDELLGAMASSLFGKEQKDLVLKAWDHFSAAIRFVPDTGANMGTNHAIGNPLFFKQPPARTYTINHSWSDPSKRLNLNPYWPFTVSRMVFSPDFTNKTNKAENYARSCSGVMVTQGNKILPPFLKNLKLAAEQMEEGLKFYRDAALKSPASKRQRAVKEVVVAEQMQRMMQSSCAILEFEDLRLQHAAENDAIKANQILDQMESVIRDEIARTELSLLAATRDSRLGFQYEQDYVYTPYSVKEKLEIMNEVADVQIPEARRQKSNKG